MIRRTPELEAFERQQIRDEPKGYLANLSMFHNMLTWARTMGAIPLKDPLEGIEDDIRLARALNARLPATDGPPGHEL